VHLAAGEVLNQRPHDAGGRITSQRVNHAASAAVHSLVSLIILILPFSRKVQHCSRQLLHHTALLQHARQVLRSPLDELKRLPTGGKGVILMGLDAKEFLRSAIACGSEGASYSGLGRAGKPTDTILDAKALKGFAGNRARKGHLVEPRLKEARLKAN
jgi:hypothetical protein